MQTAPATQQGLQYDRTGEGIVILISPWLRRQLDTIDNFVASHVMLPWEYQLPNIMSEVLFQPTFCSAALSIKLDSHCIVTVTDDGETYELPIGDHPQFGLGKYKFQIEAPSVYIGPLKYGKKYTTNLRVVRIHCDK